MNHATCEIIDKVESSTAFLSCAIEAMWLLQNELEHNLMLCKKSDADVGRYLQISSAMVPVLREMDRLKADLDAVVDAAYKQMKEGKICQD